MEAIPLQLRQTSELLQHKRCKGLVCLLSPDPTRHIAHMVQATETPYLGPTTSQNGLITHIDPDHQER